MRVVGTAGHVDHGKSTLVQALTGIDPDRLKEEKTRGMTIDLGFAWFDLVIPPHDRREQIGLVDVPGHIDFIKNMLAGIGGIDAALLVIAADEGVMPQTREHLDILDLLAVPSMIVALTKTDLIDEEEWLDLVELDVTELLQTTRYAEAPVVRVSPMSGQGMTDLHEALIGALTDLPDRRNRDRPRLPIDRVFSLSGFGTVVTGTLTDGRFTVGDAVEILPSGAKGRIRGLQTHKQSIEHGEPGSRLAINLSGIATEAVQRGDVVVRPSTLKPTDLVDVSFRMLPTVSRPLKHNAGVNLFTGSSETPARVRLLGTERLEPGQEGWLQLRLERPVVAAPGDRYILRLPSPSITLGGGAVIDAHPRHRWRRYDERVLARLQTLSAGTPDEIVLDALAERPLQTKDELVARSGLDVADGSRVVAELLAGGAIIAIGRTSEPRCLTSNQRDHMVGLIGDSVAAYHVEYPLRQGMPKGELRSTIQSELPSGIDVRVFNELVDLAKTSGAILADEEFVRLPDFRIQLTEDQCERVQVLLETLAQAGVSPPNQNDLLAILDMDERLLDMLLDDERVIRIGEGIVYRSEDFKMLARQVSEYIRAHGSITLAQARDLLGTSRRYAQAILEELDARHVTRRDGDERVLRAGE